MQPSADELALVGRRVKTLRKAKAMSQAELAKRAGVDQKTVSNIERAGGAQKSVRLSAVSNVARALGVSTWQLLIPENDSLTTDPRLPRILHNFAAARPDGQANIDRVAELESRYSIPPPKA